MLGVVVINDSPEGPIEFMCVHVCPCIFRWLCSRPLFEYVSACVRMVMCCRLPKGQIRGGTRKTKSSTALTRASLTGPSNWARLIPKTKASNTFFSSSSSNRRRNGTTRFATLIYTEITRETRRPRLSLMSVECSFTPTCSPYFAHSAMYNATFFDIRVPVPS